MLHGLLTRGDGRDVHHKGVHGMAWEEVEQWERAQGSLLQMGFNADGHGLA